MSSFVRRLAIRMMKRSGYTREKWIVERDPNGKPRLVEVERGGEITDPDDNPIGRNWPTRIPARIKVPTREQPKNFRTPRAMRRCKPNAKRQAQLDAAKAMQS